MGSEQQFCLRWNNFQSSIFSVLNELLDGGDLTDVTLSAEGKSIRAHRVVLSGCSSYFKNLFKDMTSSQHPVIVLQSTKYEDLSALVTFMYNGVVNIFQDQLSGLLKTAESLQIRGLAQVPQSSIPSQEEKVLSDCSSQPESPVNSGNMKGSSPPPKRRCYGGAPWHPDVDNEQADCSVPSVLRVAKEEPVDNGSTESVLVEPLVSSGSKEQEREEETKFRLKGGEGVLGPAAETVGGEIEEEPEIGLLGEGLQLSPAAEVAAEENRGPGLVPHLLCLPSIQKGTADLPTQENSQAAPVMEGGGRGSSISIKEETFRAYLPHLPLSRQSVHCPICGRLISQQRNLKQHMRHVHRVYDTVVSSRDILSSSC